MQKEGRHPAYLKGLPRERISLSARHTGVDVYKGGARLLQLLFVGVVCVDGGTVAGTGVADLAVSFSL